MDSVGVGEGRNYWICSIEINIISHIYYTSIVYQTNSIINFTVNILDSYDLRLL